MTISIRELWSALKVDSGNPHAVAPHATLHHNHNALLNLAYRSALRTGDTSWYLRALTKVFGSLTYVQ